MLARELLDSAGPEAARRNLEDIARINRWFGGHAVLRRLVGSVARPGEAFSLLDVGAASGDTAWALQSAFPNARITSLDCKPLHLASAPPPKVAADAFGLPFRSRSFDFVLCSLFLHHFDDASIVALLASFAAAARRAVLVSDLERSPVAYHFLPATRKLFGWHPLTVHDGPVSVEAGFTAAELESLAGAAGLRPRVRRHRPWFRLSLAADVSPQPGEILAPGKKRLDPLHR